MRERETDDRRGGGVQQKGALAMEILVAIFGAGVALYIVFRVLEWLLTTLFDSGDLNHQMRDNRLARSELLATVQRRRNGHNRTWPRTARRVR